MEHNLHRHPVIHAQNPRPDFRPFVLFCVTNPAICIGWHWNVHALYIKICAWADKLSEICLYVWDFKSSMMAVILPTFFPIRTNAIAHFVCFMSLCDLIGLSCERPLWCLMWNPVLTKSCKFGWRMGGHQSSLTMCRLNLNFQVLAEILVCHTRGGSIIFDHVHVES